MKKNYLISIFALFCFSALKAQVKVASDGDVGIGLGGNEPCEELHVGGDILLHNDLKGLSFTIDMDGGSTSLPKVISSQQLGGDATMELMTYNNSKSTLSTAILIRGNNEQDIEFYNENGDKYVHFDGDNSFINIYDSYGEQYTRFDANTNRTFKQHCLQLQRNQ